MKTINYLLAVALAGATLAGCSKRDNNFDVAADNIAPAPAQPTSRVSFVVKTMAQRPGQFHWDMGTIAVAKTEFDGIQLHTDVFDVAEYTDKNIAAVDIINPSVTNLGAIAVPFGLYQRVSFGLKLAPVKEIRPGMLSSSLFLSGTFTPNPTDDNVAQPLTKTTSTPIQVVINDPVLMSGTWLMNVNMQQPAYTATMTIDPANIMAGISETMLNNAIRTNQVIYITSTSNQNLYGMIIKNLENHVMDVQMSMGPIQGTYNDMVAKPLLK